MKLFLTYTHGVNNLPIAAIVYYINTFDSQLFRDKDKYDARIVAAKEFEV